MCCVQLNETQAQLVSDKIGLAGLGKSALVACYGFLLLWSEHSTIANTSL